jgi:hypothetical protein
LSVIPGTVRSINRRIMVQAAHDKQENPISKITKGKGL